MEIYLSSRIERHFRTEKALVKKWGKDQARKIAQRLEQFRAVTTLADIGKLIGPRCHELKGERAGQFAVDLVNPRRLVFEPASESMPRKPDGGVDWLRVTKIRILDVEDYHG